MACGSSCCGPPAAGSSERTAPIQTPIREDVDDCCGDASSMADKHPDQPGLAGTARDEPVGEAGSSRLIASTPCRDTCCGEPSEERQGGARCEVKDAGTDGDCGTPNPKPACSKGCCSVPEPPRLNETRAPSCCEGKAAPCCDQSCLDRLALREFDSHDPASATSHGKLSHRSLHVHS